MHPVNRPPMRLLCPAKINLHLRVGPRRGDGFHPLLSWMCTVGLFDTLTLESVGSDGTNARGVVGEPPGAPITLTCDSPDLPCDARNLVVRVAAAWGTDATAAADGAARAGRSGGAPAGSVTGLRAALAKRIPVGAGLGGGSSDAARALLGLNRLWRTNRAADELSAFAARFGSDLPFFFFGPSSVCAGRGEVVRPVARPAPRWALLVLPPIHMPTADVYRRFDELGLGREADVTDEPDWRAWASLGAANLLLHLRNDLEPAAFSIRADLGDLRADVERVLGRVVRMSGSGSSLFTLFDERAEADNAAGVVAGRHTVRVEVVELAPEVNDDLRDD